jgi:biopolymer transport protein ExbB/TolQ
MTQDKHELVKNVADIVSVFATIGSFLQVITPFFGLIGAVWTLMRIAEMVTGKEFHELIRRKKDATDEKDA